MLVRVRVRVRPLGPNHPPNPNPKTLTLTLTLTLVPVRSEREREVRPPRLTRSSKHVPRAGGRLVPYASVSATLTLSTPSSHPSL